ncbi:MAG: metalloregulator ArsR/SmtB family transcription factor [Anaerovoracaceae bacterium]
MNNTHKENACVFKAFCDETPLAILKQLRSGEKCACVLIDDINVKQSALSYHMKILCESGIVASRQEGKWTHYHLSQEGTKYAKELLVLLTTPKI